MQVAGGGHRFRLRQVALPLLDAQGIQAGIPPPGEASYPVTPFDEHPRDRAPEKAAASGDEDQVEKIREQLEDLVFYLEDL